MESHSLAAALLAGAALAPRPSAAAQLTSETARAFDQYVAAKEARAARDLAAKKNFLYIDALPPAQKNQAYANLTNRQILVQRDDQCATPAPACTSSPGGLIHDWIGIVFVPGVSLREALATLQDYNRD
ncbi:MAG: hypothetical protein WBG29_00805, partial [Candidatus Acidiferrales bacterium]